MQKRFVLASVLIALVGVALVGILYMTSLLPPDGVDQGNEPQAREVSWEQAVSYIENCEAEMIFQSHALDVFVHLKDGSRVHAKEPAIDDVFRVVDRTRDECGTIPMATE